MEKDGLDELIELEKKKEEQSFLFEADNDDAKSNIDLREFERRLKSSRSARKKNDSSSSEDDDFEGLQFGQQSYAKSTAGSVISKNAVNQSTISKSKAPNASKIEQSKPHSQQNIKPKLDKKDMKKYDDPQVEAIMKSGNVEQKVKELLQKYNSLLKNFDREKGLRMKYEGENLSQNKTKLEESTSSQSQSLFSTGKIQKGSILSAINSNEENVSLKQSVLELSNEVSKKDKMIADLIQEKAMGRAPGGSASNGFQALEESKLKRIEAEIKILKKERDEFFSSRFDKIYHQKNGELVKDLSVQNSKMRSKIDELEQILKNRK